MLLRSSNPHPYDLRAASAMALRAALASILAVACAHALHLRYPLYALIGAVIVSESSVYSTAKLGLYRLIGTALGAMWGAVLSTFFGHAVWAMGAGVFLMMGLCLLAGLPEAAKLAGYVAGLVVLEHSDDQWYYALHRFIETALGIAAAFAVGLAFPAALGVVRPPVGDPNEE